MQISLIKKASSFLFPVTIKKIDNLKLQLYQNQLILTTGDAIYSYSTLYAPFRKSFHFIKKDIPHVKNFLLLGTGLGSALKILQKKYNSYPNTILVDNNEDIISMSMEFMNLNKQKNVQWVATDAYHYMQHNAKKFDVIGVDVFVGTVVPYNFQTEDFFKKCKNSLNHNGIFIYNFIAQSENDFLNIETKLHACFTQVEIIKRLQNHFYICRNENTFANL